MLSSIDLQRIRNAVFTTLQSTTTLSNSTIDTLLTRLSEGEFNTVIDTVYKTVPVWRVFTRSRIRDEVSRLLVPEYMTSPEALARLLILERKGINWHTLTIFPESIDLKTEYRLLILSNCKTLNYLTCVKRCARQLGVILQD